jgi:hypothetical protein
MWGDFVAQIARLGKLGRIRIRLHLLKQMT